MAGVGENSGGMPELKVGKGRGKPVRLPCGGKLVSFPTFSLRSQGTASYEAGPRLAKYPPLCGRRKRGGKGEGGWRGRGNGEQAAVQRNTRSWQR